jgi:hypothetical protein
MKFPAHIINKNINFYNTEKWDTAKHYICVTSSAKTLCPLSSVLKFIHIAQNHTPKHNRQWTITAFNRSKSRENIWTVSEIFISTSAFQNNHFPLTNTPTTFSLLLAIILPLNCCHTKCDTEDSVLTWETKLFTVGKECYYVTNSHFTFLLNEMTMKVTTMTGEYSNDFSYSYN